MTGEIALWSVSVVLALSGLYCGFCAGGLVEEFSITQEEKKRDGAVIGMILAVALVAVAVWVRP